MKIAIDRYQTLIDNLTQGFCIIKMIFNETDQPIDYLFLEANDVFEEQTGLKNIIGRKIKDLVPNHEEHWFRIYGDVAKTGRSVHFENEAANLKEGVWYDVFAFRIGGPCEDIVAVLFNDITDRKKYEQSIRQNQERFSTILNNSQDIIYCANLQSGRYEYFSPISEEILGYSVPELLAMDIGTNLSMVHPDYTSIVEKAHLDSIESGRSKVEYLQRTKSGSYLWLSNHMITTKDNDGIALYRYGNIRNITDQKKSREELSESESRFRKIVETSGEGIIMADPDGRFNFVNQRFADMLGYSREEILGRTGTEFLYNRQDENSVQNVREQLKSGKVVQNEIKFGRSDGSILWTLYNANPLFDFQGNHIGNLAMHSDITKRKEVEEKLEETQKIMNLALERGSIGIWTLDFLTNKIFWDERMVKMFGFNPDTLDNTHQAFEKLINEEDLSRFDRELKETIENDIIHESIFRTIPINGKIRYITSKAFVEKDDLGKPLKLIGVCMDETSSRERTEKHILDLNEELLRSNKDLENFAYVASHDLQESLRMVTSFTQLLKNRYKDKLDEDANTYINYAVDGSKRMSDLLNGLLKYSRIKYTKQEFTEVDMNEVVKIVKSNLRLKIEESQAIIKCHNLPVIIADAHQMVQLIQNLVENGIKYVKNPPKITISALPVENQYIFSVSDNGIGIESQYYERIFKIFQRLHTRETYDGTGVGLAICQRIVERHGGRIWVESKPGQGSEFLFAIPIK